VARAAYYRVAALTSARAYRILVLTAEIVNRELLGRETSYTIRLLSPDEVLDFSDDPDNLLPPAFVAETAAKGDWCVGVLDGDGLASYGWYSSRPTVVDRDMTIHFSADYVYMYHGYTRPSYRGLNLHGLGLARAPALFSERGYAGVVTLADWANYASVRSAYRTGFSRVGAVVGLGRGPRAKFLVSRGCRPYGVSVEATGARLYEETR
jgi:hypothetical protein